MDVSVPDEEQTVEIDEKWSSLSYGSVSGHGKPIDDATIVVRGLDADIGLTPMVNLRLNCLRVRGTL